MSQKIKSQIQGRSTLALAILLTTLLLSACIIRLAYNNADWLLVWQLDKSFDLTRPQKEFLKGRLAGHLHWHRETELTKTIVFLRNTQAAVANGMTKNQLENALAEFATLRNTLAAQLADDSAEFFAQVSDEQLEHLQDTLKKSNKAWEKRLALPPRKRSAERTERILDIVTDWIGALSDAQTRQLTPSIERLPDVLEIWLAHTKERQRQFVELVRAARTDRAAASSAFTAWIGAEDVPPELIAHRTAVYELTIEIDRQSTQTQRSHAIRKLQSWIDDLQLAVTQDAT